MVRSRVSRRRFLQLSGGGAAAAQAGGIAGILAAGRAPAYAQQTAIHWLRWNDFVPASDQLLKTKIAPQCEKDLGIKLNIEGINANDIQARITSAVQSGSGPDVILALSNWPQLYADSVADVSDVAEEIGKAQGGFYDLFKIVAQNNGKWLGVPWTIVAGLLTSRKSWFEEAGYAVDKVPGTWDEYRAAGKKLKAAGHPFGQTAGHTFGDAPSFWYPFLWSFGGREIADDKKTVVLDSKETVESVKFAVAFWNDCCDPGGLAWDDSSNNRAFLAGTISSTNNGASIYIEAKRKPDSYQTEKGKPMKDDVFHTRLPKGPAGQFIYPTPMTDMVMGYSKNQKAAKDFLRWVNSKPVFAEWFTSQQGFCTGATTDWEKDPVWNADPVLLPFKDAGRISTRYAGFAGPSNRAAAETVTKYIITDMYAKAIQGTAPADAVKWAHGELAKIYT
jgi:ABC-type glycerol-3-phosphate transport system substrate-binding protein